MKIEERKILFYFITVFFVWLQLLFGVCVWTADIDDDWTGSLNWTADVTKYNHKPVGLYSRRIHANCGNTTWVQNNWFKTCNDTHTHTQQNHYELDERFRNSSESVFPAVILTDDLTFNDKWRRHNVMFQTTFSCSSFFDFAVTRCERIRLKMVK